MGASTTELYVLPAHTPEAPSADTTPSDPQRVMVTERRKLTRRRRSGFKGSTGDDNDLHFKKEVAVSVGFPDVIVHGGLIADTARDLIRRRGIPGVTGLPMIRTEKWKYRGYLQWGEVVFVRFTAKVRSGRNGTYADIDAKVHATLDDRVVAIGKLFAAILQPKGPATM